MHPLPKPPPCPPDPWATLGESWQQVKQLRKMLGQVLIDVSMTDPRFTALLQTMIDQSISNALPPDGGGTPSLDDGVY